jgi:4-hydroxy-tetrahydrodipicolinate reductase
VCSSDLITDNLEDNINNIDVFIDFTLPSATISALNILKKAKKPVVIGTTGFNDSELKQIIEISEIIPIVLSSNYSIGVNVMLKLLKEAVRVMKND